MRQDDLGEIRLTPDALAGRSLIGMQVHAGTMAVRPGDRVALLLTPHATVETATPLVLDDVLVLAADEEDGHVAVVAAVPSSRLAALAAALGGSNVHVVRPMTP